MCIYICLYVMCKYIYIYIYIYIIDRGAPDPSLSCGGSHELPRLASILISKPMDISG